MQTFLILKLEKIFSGNEVLFIHLFVNFRLMRIHEHGLSERENTRMYTKKPRCIGHTGNFITASLVDTKPALLILLWGYLTAFVVFLTEFFIRRFQQKKHSRE